MPRKTKKQKIRAFVKREFSLDELAGEKIKNEHKVDKRVDKSALYNSPTKPLQDLVKSVLFGTILVSLELVIYLLWF